MLKRIVTLSWLIVAVPLAAWAQDCREHVRSTEHSLATLKQSAGSVSAEKKPRVRGFLDDAARVLEAARGDCERAQTPLDHSFAIAKILVAQGNLAAAQLLIQAR